MREQFIAAERFIYNLKRPFGYEQSDLIYETLKRFVNLRAPHRLKERVVKDYADRFAIRTLIETGTYFGEMIEKTKDYFKRIYSIELDETLFKLATNKFSRFSHISIIHGNSTNLLPELLGEIRERSIFWLDAHYTGGFTEKNDPEMILNELTHILTHPILGHVILIDDARLFSRKHSHPTINEIRNVVSANRKNWIFEIRDDIIRIHDSKYQGERSSAS
jgi:hypothetical protein